MERDFVKLNKKIKLDKIIDRLKKTDARIMPELSILLNEIGLVQIIDNNPSSITVGAGLIALSYYILAKDMRYERIIHHNSCYDEFQKLLKDTKTYENCKSEYINYIHKFNTLIEQLDINNLMEIIVLFQKLFQEGYLFKDRKGRYNTDAVPNGSFNSMLELDELLGCRVSTGTYVCRHVSSLLNDILNSNSIMRNNNISTTYAQVWITDEENNMVNYKKNTAPNHAIILFKDNDKYVGYCPTMNCFISIEGYVDEIKGTKIKAYDISDKSIRYYGVISSYNDFKQDQIKDNTMNETDLNQLLISYLKSKEKIDSYGKEPFTGFYINTKENLDNMSECIDAMVPKKNKVKQLIIK